ncbi:uncharacterized protein C18orf63 homolog [Hemitrygon akajei]|uniref:uncharacterized protein C18orf63 homolog n=1 Tax=Hemitrygon akajei TaxID=2704970 RepID=UPI003BFA0EA9
MGAVSTFLRLKPGRRGRKAPVATQARSEGTGRDAGAVGRDRSRRRRGRKAHAVRLAGIGSVFTWLSEGVLQARFSLDQRYQLFNQSLASFTKANDVVIVPSVCGSTQFDCQRPCSTPRYHSSVPYKMKENYRFQSLFFVGLPDLRKLCSITVVLNCDDADAKSLQTITCRNAPVQFYPRVDLESVLTTFFSDLKITFSSLCGLPIKITSKPYYATNELSVSQAVQARPPNLTTKPTFKNSLTRIPAAKVSGVFDIKKQEKQTHVQQLSSKSLTALNYPDKGTEKRKCEKQEKVSDSKPKKPKTKPVIQDVDVEKHAKNDQLFKVNSATLQSWLKCRGVSVRTRDKKEQLVSKIMEFIKGPQNEFGNICPVDALHRVE